VTPLVSMTLETWFGQSSSSVLESETYRPVVHPPCHTALHIITKEVQWDMVVLLLEVIRYRSC
jgi:hypothetical protein